MNTSIESNTTLLTKYGLYPSIYIIYTAAYTINLFLGLPTNLYVLWLIVTGAGGLVASDFFTLNLTVSEILFCLNCLLNIIYIYFQINGVVVSVIRFCTGFISTGRPLSQCSVCVERYLAVVHPATFLKYKPLRYRVGCSGLVWLMVLGSCFVHMLNTFKFAINYIIMGFSLVVFSVMLFCCLAVLRVLKRPGPGEGDREREGINMKMRAFRIIVIIMVAMLMNYFTIIVAIPLQNFLEASKLGLAFSICFSITVVLGLCSPFSTCTGLGNCPVSGVPEEISLKGDVNFFTTKSKQSMEMACYRRV